MNFDKIKNVYFLGIGGIGMSAIARYFKVLGKTVAGYDKTPTTLTGELEREGISIHYEDNIGLLPGFLRSQPTDATLVIFTPAIPPAHSELNYLRQKGFVLNKRSQVLGMITENSYTIAVAGTHGKTTTSSMIAHLLKASGIDCTAFLGGISKNYNSNLLLSHTQNKKKYIVVEADEYDRSFLTLKPDVAVITSMDADHLDIYGDKKYLEESYRMFAGQVKQGGKLIFKKGLPLEDIAVDKAEYSAMEASDYSASDIKISNHRYQFTWNNKISAIKELVSEMPGLHNVENAVAAIAVARYLGLEPEQIKAAFKTYSGVKRRFDYQVKNEKVVYIDDYAHHPEELRACISSVKELYPGKWITGIFQPHLFSRTRDFTDGFAKSLSMLDDLILLDIYPARELPIPGVTASMILEKVTIREKMLCQKESLPGELKNHRIEVLLTLGAGDIDQLVEPIREYLLNKLPS